MKEDIHRSMKERRLDSIFIIGNLRANPTLSWLVPDVHMFRINLVLRRDDRPVLIYRDLDRAAAEASDCELLNVRDLARFGYNGYRDAVKQTVSFFGSIIKALDLSGRIAFNVMDDVSLYYQVLSTLMEEFPTIEFTVDDTGSMFKQARKVKDEQEIDLIRRVGQKSQQVFRSTETYLSSCSVRDGHLIDDRGEEVTIGQVKRYIEVETVKQNLVLDQGLTFSQGRHAAFPHHNGKEDDVICTGTTLVFDYFPYDRETGTNST